MEAPKPDIAGMILIGKSFVIKGQVSCDGDLYIDGQVEGSVDPKGNRLTIGPDGRLKANVTARAVVVQGKLEGNIRASEKAELRKPAAVTGDIFTQRIAIEEGAYFRGKIDIQREAPKPVVAKAESLAEGKSMPAAAPASSTAVAGAGMGTSASLNTPVTKH